MARIRPSQMSDECLRLAAEVAAVTDGELYSIAKGKLNEIVGVDRDGVRVATDRSRRKSEQGELVPGWMIDVAWDHLRREGVLTQQYLRENDELRVKRSAFVIALLSRFPGVQVTSRRPAELAFNVRPRPSWAPPTVDPSTP